jgi:hypothetical protein
MKKMNMRGGELSITKGLSIKDFLPFSDNSIGYICDKIYYQKKHSKLITKNMGGSVCDSCD